MVRALLWVIFFAGSSVYADDSGVSSKGVKMELSLGLPSLTITNPDSTKANYKGLAGAAKGFIPLLADKSYRADLTAGFRYLDFENTANGDQSEYAQYVGPGLGLEFSISRFYAGADYYYLKGRHTTVGTFSNKSEFNVTGLNYYLGFRINFGTGALGVAWSQMNSTIPGGDVGISGDSKWSQQTYWLQFTYNFKTDTGKFVRALFGK